MASGVFSSIKSLSTKLLHTIRGTPSTSHQHQDQASPVSQQQQSVREDLEKLSRMLVRIQAVQQDAEEKEIHDCSVHLWLVELRGVAYQAEDVLDEFYYEVLRSIVESGDAAIEAYHKNGGTKRKFVEMYTSSSIASDSFTITKTSIPDGIAEKIKSITEMFEEISNARRDLHLKEEDGTRLVVDPQIRPPTSSHVDERATFGREEEKEEIISLLNPSNGPDFMVLPIVGMGGFGKTTLAQLVFNDSRIHGLFNKKCWVSVSEDFDLVRLTKAIVESMSNSPCEFSELSKLQDVLKKNIKDLGLFLVLDDVWNEKRNLWESFQVGFFGAKFVRILTTTRNTSVAKIMQTTSPFQLGSLPESNCWSLFKHFAFGNRETSENANLHKIGRRIAKKCNGSPLAIKALGGILRYEMDEEKWREILESNISEIDVTGEIMPALRLSYQKLPRHLKPCFLYLSMFPKDESFEKKVVVGLWIAQGYINGNTRYLKTLEEIGSEYFDELQNRSLVDCGPYTGYILHDLIHDLARSISQEAYQPVIKNDQQCNGPCKVYHLYNSFLAPNSYCSIRTFIHKWPISEDFDFAITSKIAGVRALALCTDMLPNTLGTLKHLRYLSIKESCMKRSHIETLPETLCLLYNLQTLVLNCSYLRELPDIIKNLINLRYFELSSDEIQQLPESIFLLRNLHTLLLKKCTKLKKLPRGLEQLTKLGILKLPNSLIYMPSGIGKFTTLKLRGHFSAVDHGMNGGLGEIKDMNRLSGLLCITGLRNIVDVEYSRNANLASKPNLYKLILNFQEKKCSMMSYRDKELHLHLTDHSSNNAKSENDENIQDEVLQSLQPHGNLTELAILNYGGRIFPSWLLNPLLPKLTTLTLNFWTEPNFLPPFGSSCPSLEVLSLSNMLNLVEWQAHDGDFPCLKKLVIMNCPKLQKIATIPENAREVTFISCPKLELLTCPSVIKELTILECGFREIMFLSACENLTISNCVDLLSINCSDGSLNSFEVVTSECCPKLKLPFPIKDVLHFMTQRAKFFDCPRSNLGKYYVYQRNPAIEELTLDVNDQIHLSYALVNSTIPLVENSFALSLTKKDFLEVESLSCTPSVGVSCQHLTLPSLVKVNIYRCRNIMSVTGMESFSNLKSLSISYCPELCSWNDITLSLSLKFLELNYCDKLRFLPLLSDQNHLSNLHVLVIKKCPRLAMLEGFHGLMKLETVELVHCRNISISPATESLQFMPHTTIVDCPLMRDWCHINNITYYEFNPIDDLQDDWEAELECAGSHSSKNRPIPSQLGRFTGPIFNRFSDLCEFLRKIG